MAALFQEEVCQGICLPDLIFTVCIQPVPAVRPVDQDPDHTAVRSFMHVEDRDIMRVRRHIKRYFRLSLCFFQVHIRIDPVVCQAMFLFLCVSALYFEFPVLIERCARRGFKFCRLSGKFRRFHILVIRELCLPGFIRTGDLFAVDDRIIEFNIPDHAVSIVPVKSRLPVVRGQITDPVKGHSVDGAMVDPGTVIGILDEHFHKGTVICLSLYPDIILHNA